MTCPQPRSFLFRLALAALLAAVLGQATPTAPLTAHPARGSAFDVQTVDVVVLTKHKDVARHTIVSEPQWPLEALVAVQVAPLPLAEPFGWPPRQTGPPALSPWRVVPPLRAPPALT